jgi:hypothetical protein
VYGRNRTARDVRSRWLAEGVDVLLEVFDRLQVQPPPSCLECPGFKSVKAPCDPTHHPKPHPSPIFETPPITHLVSPHTHQ